MHFIEFKGLKKMLLGVATVAAMSSCHSAREVVYIQDAAPASVQTIMDKAGQVKVRPGDDIKIFITCDDQHANSLLNLISETTRLSRQNVANAGVVNAGNGQDYFLSYTVSPEGTVDFPIVGKIAVGGLTRQEIADRIKESIISNGVMKDGSSIVVTVQFANLMYTAVGEVVRPGAYAIDRDRINLFEALGMAGDLTVYGKRDRVWVIREDAGTRSLYQVDLRSTDFMNSPAYYIQQGDVIYVEPNNTRTGQSSVNENTFKSVGFWTSLVSIAVSVATLIVTLTR